MGVPPPYDGYAVGVPPPATEVMWLRHVRFYAVGVPPPYDGFFKLF